MSYFNREAIVERRQPQLSWSAVFAGAVISLGVWVVLQVWGVGIGLSSLDVDRADGLRRIAVGTGVWSLISPVVAMFLGGVFAGWLAHARERIVGGAHGLVVWALASIVGCVATLWTGTMLAVDNAGSGAVPVHVAHRLGTALIWVGGSLAVSLAAAVLGGMVGARRADRSVPPPRSAIVTTDPDV